jgi:helicase
MSDEGDLPGSDDRPSSRKSTLDSADYRSALLEAISSASSRVWLKVPWIYPPEGEPADLLGALRKCVNRGVDVRVLLRPEASNTATLQNFATWQVPHRVVRYLHEKELLVDDRFWAFSANFTPTDLVRNSNTLYEIYERTDIDAAAAAVQIQWDALESEAAAGDEEWTAADQIVPEELLGLLGRERLNPLQSKALPVVFGSGISMIVTAPTGAGKFTVGEAACLKEIKLNRRKAALIGPSRALAHEQREAFNRWRSEGVRVAILSGDEDVDISSLARADLWVGTYESFESAFRKSALADVVADLGCVVIDEIHKLGDETRGPLLEALLARLRLLSSRTRLVGLSATVANNQELAEWLQAELVEVCWRPIQLTTQLVPYETQDKWIDNEKTKDVPTKELVREITEEGGSIVIFCGSKHKVRHVATELAGIPNEGNEEDIAQLALENGVGIHYRGLSHINKVNDLFRSRDIKKLVATTTLSTGVNMPARAVVVRDTTLGKDSPLSVGEALQMAGRAGRFGQEEEGFAFILVPDDELRDWKARLADGNTVRSRLAEDLADYVLAEVLLQRIQSVETLRDWFAGTFAAHQGGLTNEEATVVLNSALELLLTSRMVVEDQSSGLLQCTMVGALTSKFFIKCEGAATVLGALPGPDPEDSTAAEDQLLLVLAEKVKVFTDQYASAKSVEEARKYLPAALVEPLGSEPTAGSIKTLLAAHVGLKEPRRLRRNQPICGISSSELQNLNDDLSRHLLWLGALGAATSLPWPPAVAADLGYRLKWAKAAPTRGSGRMLKLLEQRILSEEHQRRLPSRFARSLREPNALLLLSTERPERVLPLIDLTTEIEATGDGLVADVQVADRQALPVNLVLTARSGPVPTLVQDEQWAGDPKVIPYPHGAAESGKVSVEAISYGRQDWGYTSQTLEVDPETVWGNPQSEIRRRIESLPQEAVILRRRLFIRRERRFRNRVEAAINSTSGQLAELANLIAGHGKQSERVWRIVETLRSLIAIDSRSNEFSTPAAVLKAGQGSPSAWAITYATLAGLAGFETGIAREVSGGEQLVALIKPAAKWGFVHPTANYQAGQLIPISPRESLGSVSAVPQPPPPPRPQPVGPAWAFLHEFREPSPPEETDLGQDEPGPDSPPSSEAGGAPLPRPSKQSQQRKKGSARERTDEIGREKEAEKPAPASREKRAKKPAPRRGWPPPEGLTQHTAESRKTREDSHRGLLDQHPRAYLPWSKEEDEYLSMLYLASVSKGEMASLLGRQLSSIQSRLKKRGHY